MDLGSSLEEITRKEIIRELLLAEDPNISDGEIAAISSMCKTAWDAPVLLGIIRAM